MWRGRWLVGVAKTPKGAKETVVSIFVVKTRELYGESYGLRWSDIDRMCCHGNNLGPVGGRHGGLTRVNSTNVLHEGLRIGEIGRQMNSKVKLVKQGVYQK
jgi:hypothetical protein